MPDSETPERQIVGELENKVERHQGETIFCLRQFWIKGKVTGDFIPPIPKHHQYYETGIISGKLQRSEKLEMQKVNFPDLEMRMGGEESPHYYLWRTYFIPIERKLTGFLNSPVHAGELEIKDLKDSKKLNSGELFLSIRDLEVFSSYLYPLNNESISVISLSYLTRTELLVGDEEVEKFLKEKKVKNYNELFGVLKSPNSL